MTNLRNKSDEVYEDNINSWEEEYKKDDLIKLYNLKQDNFTYEKKQS